MGQARHLLVVNPGSTSTKLAIARDEAIEDAVILRHSAGELSAFPHLWDQLPFRLDLCRAWAKPRLDACDAVVGMGGLLRPLTAGTYPVNERMLRDARANLQGEHASNLGCALAAELAGDRVCPSFVVDPVSVDEFEPLAAYRSEEHTSELQSRRDLVCRLLLEKKN